jgi:LacI family transcriptional regulator
MLISKLRISNMQKIINRPFIPDLKVELPLYEQVGLFLQRLIDESFEHDERFYTERELIRLLKVSQPTVRRAMQGLVDKRVLRRRVGQGTFVQKFPMRRLVGLIAPYWRSPILMQQISSFAEACEAFGCDLRMHYIRQGDSVRNVARSLSADATQERMVLWGQSHESAEVLSDELGQRDFKSVCTFPFSSEFPGRRVGVDLVAGVRIALDYLTGLGHERIAFIINEPATLGTIKVRLATLRDEVQRRGLAQCSFISCDCPRWSDSAQAAYHAMDGVMKLQPRPTAIVPISGIGAWAVLRYAAKHQISVPDIFSVFSFADLTGSDLLYPALTGLDVDWKEVAMKALEILWSDTSDLSSEQTLITPRLIERESVGASNF